MTYSSDMTTYLFRVVDVEDARKLDADFLPHKIGERIYLHEFYAKPEAVYKSLRASYGIVGPVQWVELPKTIVTEGDSGTTDTGILNIPDNHRALTKEPGDGKPNA